MYRQIQVNNGSVKSALINLEKTHNYMSLDYKAVQSNMVSKDGKKKWFPHIVKRKQVVTTEDISLEMSHDSSLTPGDIHNVMRNLPIYMKRHLLDGKSVRLDGLGTFTIKAHSGGNGVDTPEEVTAEQIKYLTIQFTPTYQRTVLGVVRRIFEGVKFNKLK